MQRYSEITSKQRREIVLLKGGPCAWGQCTFCDYIDDNELDPDLCNRTNLSVLSQVTGKYKALEVINSGSVFELPTETMEAIRTIVTEKGIQRLYFESHWSYRHRLQEIRDYFGIPIVFKCGIETFDDAFRNQVLRKGILFSSPQEVSRYFQSICLMVGIQGQTKEMIARDIEILLSNFDYGCVNLYNNNSTPIQRDEELIQWFSEQYRFLEENPKIDVLFENTDFGVGVFPVNKALNTQRLIRIAMIAALYFVCTVAFAPLSFGPAIPLCGNSGVAMLLSKGLLLFHDFGLLSL